MSWLWAIGGLLTGAGLLTLWLLWPWLKDEFF
jgi:hypothetical protein